MPIFRTAFCESSASPWWPPVPRAVTAERRAPAPTPSGPRFDGTYRFDFDGAQQLAGGAPKPTQSRSRSYAVRSTCTDTGCIATATKLADNDPKRKSDPPVDLVLDYVDGPWQMVHREDSTCSDGDAKVRQSPHGSCSRNPTGALTGISYVAMNPSPECAVATQTPITVTRVGDIDPGIAVPDPGKQRHRVHRPRPKASAGHYSETSVSARRLVKTGGAASRHADDVRAQHHRLHDLQVLPTAAGTSVVNSLVFYDGKWTSPSTRRKSTAPTAPPPRR